MIGDLKSVFIMIIDYMLIIMTYLYCVFASIVIVFCVVQKTDTVRLRDASTEANDRLIDTRSSILSSSSDVLFKCESKFFVRRSRDLYSAVGLTRLLIFAAYSDLLDRDSAR